MLLDIGQARAILSVLFVLKQQERISLHSKPIAMRASQWPCYYFYASEYTPRLCPRQPISTWRSYIASESGWTRDRLLGPVVTSRQADCTVRIHGTACSAGTLTHKLNCVLVSYECRKDFDYDQMNVILSLSEFLHRVHELCICGLRDTMPSLTTGNSLGLSSCPPLIHVGVMNCQERTPYQWSRVHASITLVAVEWTNTV